MAFIVIYDACVLYPAPLRDFLLRLALTELFAARWSNEIHDEWIGNVLQKRPELERKLERTRALMDQAIPDALVTGHQALVSCLQLPDSDDRHVLAAAIRCGAQAIITFNLKDFPTETLATYGMEAIDPDDFVVQQFDLHQNRVLQAAKNHRASLQSPPKSVDEYLDTLASQGLVKTVSYLSTFGDFI
jgi:predicted nucleic acid-binding protein